MKVQVAFAVMLVLPGATQVPQSVHNQTALTEPRAELVSVKLNEGNEAEKLKKEAMELGITVGKKSLTSLAQEVFETKLLHQANEAGISLYGKDISIIIQEVQDWQLKTAAKKLSIAVENRSLADIKAELEQKNPAVLSELQMPSWTNNDQDGIYYQLAPDVSAE